MRPLCLSPNSGFQWEAVGELRMVGVLGWDAPCIVSKQLLIHEPASPYKTCHHEYLLQSKRHFATTLLSYWVLGDDRVVLVPSAFANLLASIARPSFADVLTDECSLRREVSLWFILGGNFFFTAKQSGLYFFFGVNAKNVR